jgi:hypothetical protein
MNEELLAASALLVQIGALLVSHNGFINFLQLSNVKPAEVHQRGPPSYFNYTGAPQREL